MDANEYLEFLLENISESEQKRIVECLLRFYMTNGKVDAEKIDKSLKKLKEGNLAKISKVARDK